MKLKNITSSIVICTRNRLNDILVALDSIRIQTEISEELIIVDSSDQPLTSHESFQMIFNDGLFPHSKLIYKHTKPGLTFQRNIGALLATQNIIYYFDDDIILAANYIEEMNTIFAQYPHYAGGMGTISNVPQKKGYFDFAKVFFLLQRNIASGKFTLSGMPTHPYGVSTFMEVEVLGGCCMAYRKSILEKYTFDENLRGYAFMEDCDFSRRVSYNSTLFFNPKAQLQHLSSPIARDKLIDNRAMYIKYYSYLFYKNFYARNRLKIFAYWWSILGLFIEAFVRRDGNYIKGYYRGLKDYYKG